MSITVNSQLMLFLGKQSVFVVAIVCNTDIRTLCKCSAEFLMLQQAVGLQVLNRCAIQV
jgi:hypothetical protein